LPFHVLRATALVAALALAACATPEPAVTTPAPAPAPQAAAPAPAAPAAPANPRAFPIFFEAWSANIDEPAMGGLDRLAELAKANPRERLLVVGFADPRGTREANVILSRLRATLVRDTLVEKGVPANRIRVEYRGPTAGFESLESRRVEVRLDQAPAPRRR
jgi:outer membrane protein OmpA-like peptidoglycan-associated protein